MNEKGWLHRFSSGFLIGLGIVVPGISGGLIAMILGVYEPIIEIMAKPWENWRTNLKLLIPIILGAVGCLFLFGRALEYLFKSYPLLTLYFFFGLIIGSLPVAIKTANREGFISSNIFSFILGLGTFFLVVGFLKIGGVGNVFPENIIGTMLEGALVAVGLVIPGLSASFLLIAFGLYEKILSALVHFQFSILIPLSMGFIPAMLLVSKGIHWLFKYKYGHTSYVILGILIGSLFLAFPGWPNDLLSTVLSFYLFYVGLKLSSMFSKRVAIL